MIKNLFNKYNMDINNLQIAYSLKSEYDDAKKELDMAMINLNNADDDFLDVAIMQFNTAMAKLNVLTRRLKREA